MTTKVTLITLLLVTTREVLHSLDIRDLNLPTYPAYTLATYRQLLTSSTLSWADLSLVQSGTIPADRVVLCEKSAVCRVKDGDTLRPGRTDMSGMCIVEGEKMRKYQLLVDMTGMARLEWRKWDMFSNPEIGTVAYNDKTFVGKLERDNGDTVIGELDYARGLNGEVLVFVNAEQVEKKTKGWALVEIEPVKYRLENITFLSPREISSNILSIGTVSIVSSREEGEEWEEEEETVEYTYPKYEYWGYTLGTVRGLQSSALVGDTTSHFLWGLENKETKKEQYSVKYRLQGGTHVNITVTGQHVRKEVPYTAHLVMVYKDGVLKRHNVSSTFISVDVEDITEDTRGPHFIKTGLPAPTTTKRPTTTTTPTTTSPHSNTIPPYNHMFIAPTPTPTLFPPPPPPVTKPNPLRQFYPDMEDTSPDTYHTPPDSVQVAVMSGSAVETCGHESVTICTLSLIYIFYQRLVIL